jgi:type II restriction enzyme
VPKYKGLLKVGYTSRPGTIRIKEQGHELCLDKEWKGRYDANGGYLVVKKDGDIVCYHFYNRNDVEDYLYNNTRFERASRSRYHFGSLYRRQDGEVYIKLNLQIRFNK